MLLTNQTTADYWFGPLHLLGGVGQTLTVDDTSATSLYLTDDSVADAINTLYAAQKITVSGFALPFPRPTGTPDVLHGSGSPEGLVYASQGSFYLRRDKMYLYQKSSGSNFSTGWIQLATPTAVSPSAALYETFPRFAAGGGLNILTSGTLYFQALSLPANTVVSSLTFVSAGTAAGTPLNQWFALYDQNLNKLAVTSDDTTNAWGTDTAKTLSFTTAFTTTYSGLHYLGIMVKATTVPTLAATTVRAAVSGLSPKNSGSSSGGLTNPASAPATAGAITAGGASIYSYVS